MGKKELRHGYTTGACAAAAARGAARMLREQRLVDEVEVVLPAGETACFRLHGQRLDDVSAACYVIKDAGDDPDVTNGAEIHAEIRVEFFTPHQVVIKGGTGVGRVTKPGLAVPVGAPAINPVPRRMILEGVKEVLAMRCMPATFTVTISIPNGEELAKKTLNERLGIVGGLSILGTTGIVRPISAKAWTDTIDTAINVALASGAETVVLSTGRTSELVAQRELLKPAKGKIQETKGSQDLQPSAFSLLPEEAFVMMGDHVGYALRSCASKGVRRVVLAGQFAKLLKIACGHEQTHVSSSDIDLQQLAEWVEVTSHSSSLTPLVRTANTARQVLEESGCDQSLIDLVCSRAKGVAAKLAGGVEIKVFLAGYHSEVLYFG